MNGLEVTRPRNLASVTRMVLRARLSSAPHERVTVGLTILGFAVATWLLMTMAGGTWMLYSRSIDPPGLLADMLESDESFRFMLQIYVILAVIACAFTLAPLCMLAAGAARMGAHATSRRLAVLRLIGLSSREVTRIAVTETAVLGIIGGLIGSAIYAVSLPAWGFLSIEAVRIEPVTMLLPFPLFASIFVATILMGILSSFIGLLRVRISPLGVAKRQMPKPLKAWRLLVLVVAIGLYFSVTPMLLTTYGVENVWPIMIFATVLAGIVLAVNIVAPWVLQLCARACSHLPFSAAMTAFRRIERDPRGTWRRVGSVALVCFVAGAVGVKPVVATAVNDSMPNDVKRIHLAFDTDLALGLAITLAIVFIAVAIMTVTTAVTSIYEQAPQAQALHRLGVRVGFHTRVAWLELVLPLLLAATTLPLGFVTARPMREVAEKFTHTHGNSVPVLTAVAAGIGVVLAAQFLVEPLRRQTALAHVRSND